jgi:hypothetical protein
MLPNPAPNLRSDRKKPIATMTVGYDNFSLSLMMAPKKEKTITSNRTIMGDSVISISQQQAVGQITVSKS